MNQASMSELDPEERMQLLRFVCSFAWVDLKVTIEERELVARMISRLKLDKSEMDQVSGWLQSPPPAESVDPLDVPHEHRVRFLRAVESVVAVDGEVTDEERETVIVFAQLVR